MNKKRCYSKRIGTAKEKYKVRSSSVFATDTDYNSTLQDVRVDVDENPCLENIDVMFNDNRIVHKPRKIPNILKNSAKIRSFVDVTSLEERVSLPISPTDTSTSYSPNSSIEYFFSEELNNGKHVKHDTKSRKRKQKHSATKKQQEMENWCVDPTVENMQIIRKTKSAENKVSKSEKSRKRICKRKLKSDVEKSERKVGRKKSSKENTRSSLSQTTRETSTDCLQANLSLESNAFSSLEEENGEDLPSSIDFSSNEIFNQYIYQFSDNIYGNCLNECCDFSTIMCNDNICEDKYDLNGNDINMQKKNDCSLLNCTKNEEENRKSNFPVSFTDRNVRQKEDTKSNSILANGSIRSSSNENNCNSIATDYSLHPNDNVYMENRILENPMDICIEFPVINDEKNIVIADRILTETSNDYSSILNIDNDVDYYFNANYTDLYGGERNCDDYTIEQGSDNNCYSSCSDETDNSVDTLEKLDPLTLEREILMRNTSEYTESLLKFLDDNNEYEMDDLTLEEKECDAAVNAIISEENCDTMEEECFLKEMENEVASEERISNQDDSNDGKLKCLLCPLTFTSSRSMVLHHAGAHGGTYIILCERCGRLFNRKYQFNRHFVHCGRLKEPFKCDMCIKQYRHRSSLVHHLKTLHHIQYEHKTAKRFKCEICCKVYSKFGAFENHLKRHRNSR